jgi:iron complex outermembrane receptor protein
MTHRIRRSMLAWGAATTALMSLPAAAQDTPSRPTAADEEQAKAAGGDIIVTARRRDETSIAVPVAITAVSGEQLAQRGIASVDALARAVPTLITSEATSSPQGGIVAIRGLSGVDANPFGDQAVSFNIDGVGVARSSVRRLSQMDIAQIEVLKGPQALFFGKNSPGGVISVRSADPTRSFQAGATVGYEFEADELRTEGFVSGPLGDTLGFRIAGYYDRIEGYVDNVAPATGAGVYAPFDRRAPNGDEFAVRGTLKWDPSDRFNARLKISYNKADGSGSTDLLQYFNCPLGVPQGSSAPENCKADDKVTTSDNIGPNFVNADPRYGGSETFLKSDQTLGGLELNYDVTDHLTLSSVTGYYKANNSYVGNFTATFADTGVLPRVLLPAYARLDIRELTQELRLTSNFDGPVNFMLGGLYQDTRANVEATVYLNAQTPAFSSNYQYRQDGTAHSIFGQAQVKFTPTLELSGGARYSYERKRLPIWRTGIAGAPRTLLDIDGPREVSFNNLSPEATLSWRPSSRLTVYGGYKEGFLSGGFNATQPATVAGTSASRRTSLIDPRYDQQLIQGFEGGVKTALLDNSLRLNLTGYTYRTIGLQVATLVGLQQELRNAGSVRTKGVEFDFNYRTPLRGLSLYGAVAYEDGKYTDYQATCYRGLPAPTCSTQVNRFTRATGLFHDLSGTQLVRAPEWSGNVGADFVSQPIGGFKIGLSANYTFSDGFFTDVVSAPGGRQKAYDLIDAGVRVMDTDERFEIALLGKNLGNTYYFTRSADNPFSGSAPGGTGTLLGDTVGVPSRGREIWLRTTVRFGGGR